MAKIEFEGITKYSMRLSKLGAAGTGIIKAAVYEGAAIVIEAVKAATPVRTGDLRDSVGLTKMQNKDGYVYTKLGFDGTDRKGVANALKARVIENGTSDGRHKKHPFIRPAVNAVKARAQAKMDEEVSSRIEKIMNSNNNG